MIHRGMVSAVALASLLLAGCGNSVYGIRKLAGVGGIDDGVNLPGTRACPATDSANPSPGNLSAAFFDLACISLRDPADPVKARRMLDAGVTLTRMRCSDFFIQRAAGQTRERAIRSAVAPVSALISGVIGLISFDTDEGRAEAIQILGLTEAATVAGLEIYESEFLFDSANVIAVRRLTMRALDSHMQGIMDTGVGFYGATRHLLDHQTICTPASILELAKTAIAEGQIDRRQPIAPAPERVAALASGSAAISSLSTLLQVDALSADEVGALWWTVNQPATPPIDQGLLEVLQVRMARLPINPIVTGADGTRTVDSTLAGLLRQQVASLPVDYTSRFQLTVQRLRSALAARGAQTALKATEAIAFSFPAGGEAPAGGAVEIMVEPGGAASQQQGQQ